MRSLGLTLIILGSLTTIPAMFLEAFAFEAGTLVHESFNTWESFHGLDIAIAASCGLAAVLALLALLTGRRVFVQLAVVAGAVTFGLTFAVIPDTIADPENARAGRWAVGATGAIALAGAVAVSVSRLDQP